MIQCDMRPNHQTTYALAGIPLNLYYSTERDSKTILWPNDPRTHLGCGQLDFNPFSSGYFISTEQNNFDFRKGAKSLHDQATTIASTNLHSMLNTEAKAEFP